MPTASLPAHPGKASAGESSLEAVSGKAERSTAREAVATYHEAEQAKLPERVGEAIDGFRSGQLDTFKVDHVLFRYSRAAKELWKFCNLGSVELTASLIAGDEPLIDWWERGALKLQ